MRRDTQGELIFDDRPYAIYDVVTSSKIEIALYDFEDADGNRRYSGTFEARFTAYEPFARMAELSYETNCCDAALNETGILPKTMMPDAPALQTRAFILYNPGTERAHTIIRMAGDVGDGLLIRNLTTGQKCKIVNLKGSSLLEGACLELDSQMGQTRIVLNGESKLAFSFHDEGYISLAPCAPFVRKVQVGYTEGSNVVTSDGEFQKRMEGQYLYLNGWKRIRQVTDSNTLILSQAMNASGSVETPIVTMNEIELQGENAVLTHFEIDYVPRVE